jgi:hypothetical protein
VNSDIAKDILSALEEFSEPISKLSECLQKIEDVELRRELRRALAEMMGILDGTIGYRIRREVGF